MQKCVGSRTNDAREQELICVLDFHNLEVHREAFAYQEAEV